MESWTENRRAEGERGERRRESQEKLGKELLEEGVAGERHYESSRSDERGIRGVEVSEDAEDSRGGEA
eukprot:764443-Hanusia_phi.AAC.9